ncbi:hypothetical protein [Sphingobium mellinum]|uniref:hypothetical protein n=1 Tax=Sphingobium mellinum TaxID=1387166 RepID=UPI0030EED254
MSDQIQCFGCVTIAEGVAEAALPDGWDAVRVPGFDPAYFCGGCVDGGTMEHYRAQQGLPRRARWRFPNGIMALYRPAARQVLLATADGMAEIGEREAEQLIASIAAALGTRALADRLMVEAGR